MDLITKTKMLVAVERKTTTEIIKYLSIIENTKMFSQMGYSSMIKFCIRELGYSEGAAYRRVEAARLLKAHPALEENFKQGELSLTNAASAGRFIKEHKIEDKEKLIRELFNKSSREAENLLLLKSNQQIKRKNILRKVSSHDFDLTVTITEDAADRLRHIKDRKSHSLKNFEELLAFMIETTLEKLNKPTPKKLEQRGRTATPALKNLLLQKAGFRCQSSGCDSTAFLQMDHKRAWRNGGRTTFLNGQILCATHNRLKS